MIKVTCFFIFLFFSYQVVSQELYGKYLTTQDGLLSKECYDIERTSAGYLLISTQYGPMRYDGEKLIPICLNLPQSKRVIYDFEKTKDGKIYFINSESQLFYLYKDKAISVPILNDYPEMNKTLFVKLTAIQNGFQISSTNELYNFYYSFQDKKIHYIKSTRNAEYDETLINPGNQLPIRYTKSRIVADNFTKLNFEHLGKEIIIQSPHSSDERNQITAYHGKQYLIVNSTFFIIENKTIKKFNYEEILFMKRIKNRVWLCSKKGLYELNLNGELIQHHFKGQIIGGITHIFSNGIAISFNSKGVFICPDINNRIIQDKQVSAIGTNGKTVLIGTKVGLIYHYTNNTLQKLFNTNKGENITDIYKIKQIRYENNQWYCYNPRGIYTFNDNLHLKKEFQNKYRNTRTYFILDKDYYQIGMFGISKNQNNFAYEAQIPLTNTTLKLSESLVMLGTIKGIYVFNANNKTATKNNKILCDTRINSMQKVGDNFIYGTHFDGIYFVRFNKIIKKIELPGNSLYKAILVGNTLYAGCNNGIFKLALEKKTNKWIKIFNGESSYFEIDKGSIYIVFNDDVIINKLNTSLNSFQFNLKEIRVSGKKTERIPTRLDFNTSLFINMDVLHFSADNLGIHLIVQGEKSFSQSIQGTEVNLNGLTPGKYSIKLYPIIDQEIDYSKVRQFDFEISPPFTQSISFYLIITLLSLAILISIFLIVLLRRRKQREIRLELQQKLEEYKMAALKAQVNPHFLSNGLSAIQALILKNENELSAQYLAKFSLLMRKILMYSEYQFVTLREELSVIEIYLELEQLRFSNKFTIEQKITLDELQLNTCTIPALILQPIVENAIWHGLQKSTRKPKLTVAICMDENNYLEVKISDNGPGIHQPKIEKTGHFSKGQKLIEDRIESINLRYGSDAATISYQSSELGTEVLLRFNPKLHYFE